MGEGLTESDDLFISLEWSADPRRPRHRGMSVQHRLDFRRVDIEPKADDELLRAPDDEEVAVLEAREVAGVDPSFRIDRVGGFLGGLVIALHDVWPARPQLTPFA